MRSAPCVRQRVYDTRTVCHYSTVKKRRKEAGTLTPISSGDDTIPRRLIFGLWCQPHSISHCQVIFFNPIPLIACAVCSARSASGGDIRLHPARARSTTSCRWISRWTGVKRTTWNRWSEWRLSTRRPSSRHGNSIRSIHPSPFSFCLCACFREVHTYVCAGAGTV